MRLIHFMTMRLLLAASVVLAFWSVLFYYAMVDEINDEQDDALEDYAEQVMRRFLRGEELPAHSNDTNNQYFLRPVSHEYAQSHESARYLDHEVYIEEKKEHEPARSIFYIFSDDQGNFYEVGVSVPTIDKDDLKEALYWFILLLYAGIIVAFALISLLTVRRTMRPLRRLLDWMNQYKPGQHNEELHIDTPVSEFSRLTEGVRQLVERNEGHERQQQLFISNASHEMQTPLAICMGRLEALLEDESLNEQQLGEVVKTLRTLGSLSHLNKSLLMLSRIGKGQYADDHPISLSSLLSKHLPDYLSLYGSMNISVQQSLETPFIEVMDEQLANILVQNLLKNAFAHNRQGGRILICSDGNELSIANTGSDKALDTSKIFLPFYHTQGKRNSTGLGLALAQAVCRRYKLSLSYAFSQGMHCFRIVRQ